MKKKFLAVVATLLVVCCAIGGTMAYLSYKSEKVTNVFTVGDVEITFEETEGTTDPSNPNTREFKMVPGLEIKKDPTFTVAKGSEACYLFVEVEKSADFDNYIDYEVADGWTALDGVPGVFYREVADLSEAQEDSKFAFLADNKVVVKDSLTKEELAALKGNEPTLSFTAYGIQKEGFETAALAWSNGLHPTTTAESTSGSN